MTIQRDTFDFEIGYLTRSPCRNCPNQDQLPECADECRILEDIQMILARGISCAGRYRYGSTVIF